MSGAWHRTWLGETRPMETETALRNDREAVVRAELATDLCGRAAVREDDVGREVVLAADQGRADAVGVDRDSGRLEGADPVGGESARGDDLHALEPVAV